VSCPIDELCGASVKREPRTCVRTVCVHARLRVWLWPCYDMRAPPRHTCRYLIEGASSKLDPPDVLDRQKCLEALAALRHAKWFQVGMFFYLLT